MELVPVLLLALVCVLPATVLGEPRMYGGEVATRKDYPYMAIVAHARDVVGNGVIISFKWVLTTSTVLNQYQPTEFCAVIGGDTLSSSSWYDVKRIWKHPEWIGDFYNIGLLQLLRAIKYTPTVQPISIATDSPPSLEGTMISFGENESGSTRMQQAPVTLYSDDTCLNSLRSELNRMIVRKGHAYCIAARNGKELRFESDDNGGAIVANNLLYSLFDIDNDREMVPSRVTDPEMRNWVHGMIDKLGA
ncbi:AGAP005792-PA-like protein [Anopheles sinensis]|uniref:AGAP005792-PA-like protein n=1 Tax=Anopheles sinensis TaxID=74873 RepID=A0A084WDK3_ANOSI|nr:AGAP005792-PA-like protein [Anopheles sinensis]